MEKKAFQELIGPENHCHGCGIANEKGLHLKSYWQGEDSVAVWRPSPHHCAGSPDVVNGGVLASLMDCLSNNLAMASAYRRAGRKVGSNPKIWCVTARLEAEYLKPVPMGKDLHLHARVASVDRRATHVECSVQVDGQTCARGKVLLIEIKRSD